jgi:hypothetical protein
MVSEHALVVVHLGCNFLMMGCCDWHFLQVLSSENQLFAKTFLGLSQVCMMTLHLHSLVMW